MGALRTFPVSTVVAGRRVAVVGGGEAAEAKLRLLAKTQALVHVYAPGAEDAVRRLVRDEGWSFHECFPGVADLEGAALAFVATEDEARDRMFGALAREAGVPVNVVDRPDLCDVLTPAFVDRAPVTIAISTEGAAPVLAGILRTRIETLLHPGLGTLARFAGGRRGRVAGMLPPGARRLAFWRRYFASEEMAEAAARGEAAIRRGAVRLLDEARTGDPGPGMVWLVGAGPGAADLLTIRAQRVLAEADVVVHDRLVDAAVLDHVRRDARRVDVGKRKGQPSASQDEINRILVAEARAGHRIVRLKAGDPMIYGRAGEEIAALRAAGIAHAVVPGVTAALGAAAETATPLTHRGHASSLVFATGHAARGTHGIDWDRIAGTDVTLTLYMARSNADEVAASLLQAGLPGDTPVGAVENATRPDARRFFGRLDALGALAGRSDVEGPVVIFVGRAVAEGEWAGALGFASTESLAA
jgi:uroporphyrin-III C-methyltransferase / precorrin-2 dehydrogenase / sirohydrochlorin ferrochelatase